MVHESDPRLPGERFDSSKLSAAKRGRVWKRLGSVVAEKWVGKGAEGDLVSTRIIVTVHNSKRVAEAPRAPSGTRKRIGTSYAARGRGERA